MEKESRTSDNIDQSDHDDSDGSDSDDSDRDGGLVLVQKRRLGDGGGESEEDEQGREELGGKGKGSKKMRITRDGVAAAAASKKRVFDEDGEAVVSKYCCELCFSRASVGVFDFNFAAVDVTQWPAFSHRKPWR